MDNLGFTREFFSVNVAFSIVKMSIVIFIASCGGGREQGAGLEPCTEEWRQFVEDRVQTGDDQGHGPDIGSAEWQSVVEFKLGIRGNPEIPSRESGEWCSYVDEMIRGSPD